MVNTITANVTSSSNPHGVLVTLTETGPNTGIFTGNFSFTSGASSGTALQVKAGDQIRVSYNASLARFTETINGVAQPGTAIITDYVVPKDNSPTSSVASGTPIFTPVGGAVNVTFVGTNQSPDGQGTVTMSYANAHLGNQPATALQGRYLEVYGNGLQPLDNGYC